MPRMIPRLKIFDWSKVPPILVLTQRDLMGRLRNSHEKNKLVYKNCLNLGLEYQVDKGIKESLIRGHVSIDGVTSRNSLGNSRLLMDGPWVTIPTNITPNRLSFPWKGIKKMKKKQKNGIKNDKKQGKKTKETRRTKSEEISQRSQPGSARNQQVYEVKSKVKVQRAMIDNVCKVSRGFI
ncbi:hypothetical protein Tco_1277282 [Tanacetum coccineum]